MKSSKLVHIFKQGNIVVPLYLMQNYKKLNLKLDEFIFLMYLYNEGEVFIFNPAKISQGLNMSLSAVMGYISSLTDKHYINVEVVKNEKKLVEEVINLAQFYKKLTMLMVDDVNESDEASESTIFEFIEKEFGRTLSPMEYEIIKAWLENDFSEDLIKEAIKEATFNGVSNLRYIDKILYEWGKRGIKTSEAVEKNRNHHRKEKEKEADLDIFDYDWFDDDE